MATTKKKTPSRTSAAAANIARRNKLAAQAKADAAAKAAANAAANKDASSLANRFGSNGDALVAFDQYGNLVLQQKIYDATGKPTGEFSVRYFYVDPNGKDWQLVDASTMASSIKKSYGKNLESLRKTLYERGYMSEKEYVTRSESAFNGAILKSSGEHSVEQVQKYTINGQTKFSTYSSWLSSKPIYGKGGSSSGNSSGTDIQKETTPKSETDQDIDAFFVDMLGRSATADEKTKYYNAVALAEKNAKRTSKVAVSGTTQTTDVTDTRLTEADLYRIKASILKPSVVGTPLEKITEGTGKLAQGVSSLKEYASAYGVKLTAQAALDSILEGMEVGGTLTTGDLDQQKAKIRTIAKATYGNLASLIDEGVKPSDIANQFAYYKGQILEIPDNAVSIFDDDIQMALNNKGTDGKPQTGVMSLVDYKKMLRTDPKTKGLWLKTTAAREEASGYALDILRTFGLMA